MSDLTPKQVIERALSQYRGDDLERAKHAFHGMTPEQMNQRYGHSDQTRQQILDGYQRHVDDVERALAWLRSQP